MAYVAGQLSSESPARDAEAQQDHPLLDEAAAPTAGWLRSRLPRSLAIGLGVAAAVLVAGAASAASARHARAASAQKVGLFVVKDGDNTSGAAGGGEAPPACGKLWAQCGGKGYEGPTCCDDGLLCQLKPLKELPTFRQCRPPACEDMETKVGSTCHTKVNADMTQGIFQHPDFYHSLTPQSSFKQFQELNWLINKKVSQCPQPCGPGTCDTVLKFDGCDTPNKWNCDSDDGSLSYHCCCKAFPTNLTQALMQNEMELKDKKHQKKDESKPSLFCVALMIPHSYEVDLVRAQLKNGNLGIFGCDEWAVFSNESVSLAPNTPHENSPKYMTRIMNGSLEVKRGGAYNTALNTPIFIHFWHTVLQDERSLKYDIVVKVDPDTMFMPERLRQLVQSKSGPLANPEPTAGYYLNNCFLGMHGPIEALSRRALKTYGDLEEKCTKGPAAEHGQEDWYLRACFEDLGILKVDAFNILLEGYWACKERPAAWKPYRPACHTPQVSFHPFKDIDSYLHCWAEAETHPVPSPFTISSVLPSPANEDHEN